LEIPFYIPVFGCHSPIRLHRLIDMIVDICFNIFTITFKKLFSYWGLTQGLVLARQVLYHLSHASKPLYFSYFLKCLIARIAMCNAPPSLLSEMGLANFFSRLSSALEPPGLHLLSSWDYSSEPVLLTHNSIFFRLIFFLFYSFIYSFRNYF
jgi:hypothetical protein